MGLRSLRQHLYFQVTNPVLHECPPNGVPVAYEVENLVNGP